MIFFLKLLMLALTGFLLGFVSFALMLVKISDEKLKALLLLVAKRRQEE